MGKRIKYHFFKNGMQMANKHIKSCSTSLIGKLKSKLQYHLTSIRMTINPKNEITSVGEEVRRLKPLSTADRVV